MTGTDDKIPEPYGEFSPEGYNQPLAYVPFDGKREDPGCLWDLKGPAIIIDGVDSQWLGTPPRTYFNQVAP